MSNNITPHALDACLLICALLTGVYPLALFVIFIHIVSRYYSHKLKNTMFKEIYNIPTYNKNKIIYYLIIIISLIIKESTHTDYYTGITIGVIAFSMIQYTWRVYKSFDFGISFSSIVDKAVGKI